MRKIFAFLACLLLSASAGAGPLPLGPGGGGAPGPVTCTFSQPAPAASAGYNTLTFCEDFSSGSTIDGSSTQAGGFNWYGSWTKPAGGQRVIINSSNYTIGSSILDLNSEAEAGGYGFETWSTNSWPASGGRVGQSFAPPFYIEFKISTTKSLAPGTFGPGQDGNPSRPSWPTLWLQDRTLLEAIIGGGSISQSYAEIDILEFYVSVVGMGPGNWDQQSNIHIWNSTTTISPDSTNHVTWGSPWTGEYHVVGVDVNSTNAKFYFDGTLMQTLSTTGGFAPAFNANYIILMNPGYAAWPLHVDYVQLWK